MAALPRLDSISSFTNPIAGMCFAGMLPSNFSLIRHSTTGSHRATEHQTWSPLRLPRNCFELIPWAKSREKARFARLADQGLYWL